ncbi:MAG: hypothetical protein JJE39_11455 [Vicinamibacteria bacterium]|nr:hypothetical protein [Vicinamibacteria bacterium]
MQDPNWEYDAVSVVGNAEVVKAFERHAEGWEFMQAWTSQSSGDWLFFRRSRSAEEVDLQSL